MKDQDSCWLSDRCLSDRFGSKEEAKDAVGFSVYGGLGFRGSGFRGFGSWV